MTGRILSPLHSPVRTIESEFHVLHVLRLLCAVAIMSNHWAEDYYTRLMPQDQFPIDLFFLIEGFLAAHLVYRGRDDLPAGRLIRRKWLEIYPLHALGLVAGLAVTMLYADASHDWTPSRLAQATLLGALGLPTFATPSTAVFPFDPPAWAIVLEFWALVAVCTGRLDHRPLILALLVAAAAVGQAGLSASWRNFNMGWQEASYLGGFTRAAYGFLGGFLLYRLVAACQSHLPKVNALVVWLAFACLLFVRIRYVALPLLFLVTPAFVALASVASCPRRLRGFGLAAKRSAYAFYLLHYPVLVAFKHLGPQLGASRPMMASVASYLLAVALAGVAAWLGLQAIGSLSRPKPAQGASTA